MNKIRLPIPKDKNFTFLIRDLVKNYLSIYSNIFVADENIRLDTYDSWDFYRVEIFRQSKRIGYGSLEHRNDEWRKTKEAINIFDIKSTIDVSWRWVLNADISTYDKIGKNKLGYIPGISFWVYKS